MKKRPVVFVAGHQRPDTDASVSAHVMAKLRQRTDRLRHYQPLLLGEPNRQTIWLFRQARTALPLERSDIRWTVAESMRESPIALPPNARLGDAIAILQRHRISMIPVVDETNRFLGVVSPRLPRNEYFFNFNVEDYLGMLLSLEDVVATFSLRPIHPKSVGPGPSRLGSFRVVSGKNPAIEPGDVLFAAADPGVIRSAERAGAQAVIIADAKLKEAREAAKYARVMPVYFYAGSMLALLSSLSLAIPLSAVMAGEVETLRPDQRLDQVGRALALAKHALPVLDEQQKLVGVLSQNDAIARPSRPLILVDHFERTQTVTGVEQASIEEIVDHHRVGAIETLMPARVDCRPVGSTATIIAGLFEEAGLEPKPREALLLLGALVSDTLLLTSPTTTAIDRRMAPRLAQIAGVKLSSFGREVLIQNDELADGEPDKLVERDVKAFNRGDVEFGAAQLETVDLGQLTNERTTALMTSLERLRQRSGWGMAVLIVTDVMRGDSRLFAVDENGARRDWVLQNASAERGRLHRGMVSRKKQLLPFLFERLDTFCA